MRLTVGVDVGCRRRLLVRAVEVARHLKRAVDTFGRMRTPKRGSVCEILSESVRLRLQKDACCVWRVTVCADLRLKAEF